MKGKKIFISVISLLMIVFEIAVAFILDNYSVKIVAQDMKILYIIAKCLCLLAFVGTVILGFLKNDLANYIIFYSSTLVLQILPLIIRYLSLLSSAFVISIILFFVTSIVYVAMFIGLLILSRKSIGTTKKLEGAKIAIEEDINIK